MATVGERLEPETSGDTLEMATVDGMRPARVTAGSADDMREMVI